MNTLDKTVWHYNMEYRKTNQTMSACDTDKLGVLQKQRSKMCLLTIVFKVYPTKTNYCLNH